MKVATKRPRHCLPYAVITWSKIDNDSDTKWPLDFSDQFLDDSSSLLINDTVQIALNSEKLNQKLIELIGFNNSSK
jgi:hypothetical protein